MRIHQSNIHGNAGRRFHAGQGFALVVTLSLMILLTVIAVGLLSLSTITLRSASQGSAVASARANARMAMVLALGELQRKMGPDQRVSVPADSLAAALLVVDPAWKNATAVLKHTEDALLPPDETPANKLKREFQGWLVSGESANTRSIDSASAPLPGSPLLLMKGKSSAEDVRAAAVPVTTPAGKGRYAWWGEDLGTKASMGLPKQSDVSLAALAPDRFDIRKIADLEGAPGKDASEWDNLISTGTSELMIANSQAVTRAAGRPVTAMHRGVLADVAQGRLKRDLTVALGENKSNMESWLGQKIYDPVSTTGTDPGGPHWEQLRQYYQSGEDGTLTVRRQTADQEGYYPVIAGMTEIYGISNTEGYAPSYLPLTDHPANWYNRTGPPAAKVMAFHMTPIIKLWNPYDRPLRAPSGYTVAVSNGNYQHTGSDWSYQDQIGWGRNGSVVVNVRPPKTTRYEHRYFIPPVTIAPGETKIFSLTRNTFLDIDGSYVPFNAAKNFGNKTNVKAKGWILGDLTDVSDSGGFTGHSFWDLNFTKQGAIPLADRERWNWTGGRSEQAPFTGDTHILDTISDAGLQFSVNPQPFMTWNIRLFAGRQVRPNFTASKRNYEPEPEAPLVNIRNANTNTTGFSKGNIPIATNANPAVEPFFLSPTGKASMWARRFVLKLAANEGDNNLALYNPQNAKTKDAKWLANFNPRSPTVGCWASEAARPDSLPSFTAPASPVSVNSTANAKPFGMGTPGNLLSGMLSSFTSQDALFLNKAIGYSDIAGPEKAVLFQTPPAGTPEKYFFSIGQLTHANLWIENGPYEADTKTKRHATEDWFADNMHPTYPIGNSYADPRLKLSENQGRFKKLTIVDGQSTYESTFHDFSYYLNRSLWDGYFFSARQEGSGGTNSYNSRLQAITPAGLKTGADGFNNNSANLLLAGAFNVNSTDVRAWTAFLSSMCDVTVGGGSPTANAAYPRVLPPLGGEVKDTTADNSSAQYTGFRALKETEVKDLAAKIVEQIKLRGPATSLADFINRSTSGGSPIEQRIKGALQTAIDATTINEKHRSAMIQESRVDTNYEPKAFAGDIAAGAPGYLTQADLLARLGHLITPRSDTFVIRCRGEALDKAGNVLASVVCEATVQRLPSYVDPTADAKVEFNALPTPSPARTFGRTFAVTAFRWLNPQEI